MKFKRAATHAARAPGRVNLIGDHIDYCDGFVLPAVSISPGIVLLITAEIRIIVRHRPQNKIFDNSDNSDHRDRLSL